jgi:hypothetical protein
LEKNKDHDKQDNKADRAKANVTGGTITRNNLLDRADKFESPWRKQVRKKLFFSGKYKNDDLSRYLLTRIQKCKQVFIDDEIVLLSLVVLLL